MIIDLLFVGTDHVNREEFVNENLFFKKYGIDDKNGYFAIGDGYIDSYKNFLKLFQFLFSEKFKCNLLFSTLEKNFYDLTNVKNNCITLEDLDKKYPNWIEISGRESSMDEYGNLLGIISYINRNKYKKNLILITEIRNLYR